MKNSEEVADVALKLADEFLKTLEAKKFDKAEMLATVVAIAGLAVRSFPPEQSAYVRAHLSKYIGMTPLPEDDDDGAHS